MFPKQFSTAGTVALAATLAMGLASSGIAAEDTLAGRWEGTVQTPGSPVVIVLDLAKGSAGGWVGSAIFPAYGVKGAPLKDITVDDTSFTFTVRTAMGEPKMTGRLSPEGTLSGKYEQGGHSVPLSLRRAGIAQVDFPKQSTPIRKELEGGWESVLDLGAFKLRLALKLASGAQGLAEGQFIMIDPSNYAMPVDLISQTGDRLELTMAAVNFGYEGLISRSNDELKGILRIGSLERPLVWSRSK